MISLESTDIRSLAALPERPTLAAVDVSFVSLTLVLPAVQRLLAPRADVVALIKPQFEVGRAGLGKGGLVTDPQLRDAAVQRVLAFAREIAFEVVSVIPSPILGTEGNTEFLAHLCRR